MPSHLWSPFWTECCWKFEHHDRNGLTSSLSLLLIPHISLCSLHHYCAAATAAAAVHVTVAVAIVVTVAITANTVSFAAAFSLLLSPLPSPLPSPVVVAIAAVDVDFVLMPSSSLPLMPSERAV